jgi:hypothetical protein
VPAKRWWLDTAEFNRKAEEVQRVRYQADAWQGLIQDYIADKHSVDIPEILEQVLILPLARWGQSEQNLVGRCLREAGWIRRQRRLGRSGRGAMSSRYPRPKVACADRPERRANNATDLVTEARGETR